MTTRPTTARPPAPAAGGRDPRHPFATSPFTRLARTHALGTAGDALFAIALAGTIFFQLDFDQARERTALYLLLTIAPFAVAAPLIGPALDRVRGGRRWLIVACQVLRVVVCFFIIRHLDSVLFYPEAFIMLVLGKVYSISKSAVVPTTVRSDEELVEANSKLTVLSAVAVVVAAPVGGALLKLGDSPTWPLAVAMVVFIGAAVTALQLPPSRVAAEPPDEAERAELRATGILLAASGMGLLRGIVGFLSFLLAFYFKSQSFWQLGVAAAAAQLGFFLGAVTAPRLRKVAVEERMYAGSLVVVLVGAVVSTLLDGLVAAALLSLLVGATSSSAKLAFDAIVQRDAPDANRGRSFARFETRFQLFWVVGALIPIVIPIPVRVGYMVIAGVAAFAVISYLVGTSQVRSGRPSRRGRRSRDGAASSASPTEPPEPPAPPAPPAISPEAPVDTRPRRWASPPPATDSGGPSTTWTPPRGFVSQRLNDDGTPPEPEGLVPPSQPFDGAAYFDEHHDAPPPPAPDATTVDATTADATTADATTADATTAGATTVDATATDATSADPTAVQVPTPPPPAPTPPPPAPAPEAFDYPDPPWRTADDRAT